MRLISPNKVAASTFTMYIEVMLIPTSFELFFLKIEMRPKAEFVELFVLQSNDVDSDAMDGNVRKRKRHDEHSL